MEKQLTSRQKKILDFIKQTISKRNYPPTVREICQAVELKSSSTVHAHLIELEKKGYIRRHPTKPRAIEVLGNDIEMVHIPIIGRVAAGEPVLAVENIEGTFPLPVNFVKTNYNIFMLKIRGDSMIKAGIFDGDYVFVQQQNTADDGDIVVALLNNEEATVKRFYKEAKGIRLQPENDNMEPILTTNVLILGKVIGVFRMLI